jgi:hypothetical protein
MSVHVDCIEVKPVSNGRTQYDVTDLTGKVEVTAHKNDVTITQSGTLRNTPSQGSSQSAIVHEGSNPRATKPQYAEPDLSPKEPAVA